MADIFLSYAKEDLAKARLLATGLEQQGWSVFWDRTSIQIGQDFDEVIEEAIEQARCMIVGWSQASKRSDWVRGEATIGRERRILLPILFEAVSPPIAFRSLHTEDFSSWMGEPDNAEFLNLCKALTRLAGNGQQNSAPISSAMPFADITPSQKNARLPFEPEMIEIPAGTFQMGGNRYEGEQPIHTVTFAKPFKLGKYPVTFAEYDAYAEQTGCKKPDDNGWGREQRPVINVTWHEAVDYAAWLGQVTGKAYRLPSEAEWEYACRAGSSDDYFWGSDESKAGEYAWFSQNSQDRTHPVGQKQANRYGLYDMTGNVLEWLQDTGHQNYQGAPNNGCAWEKGDDLPLRVLRGGSWYDEPSRLRSATRYWSSADNRGDIIGFRLAQD